MREQSEYQNLKDFIKEVKKQQKNKRKTHQKKKKPLGVVIKNPKYRTKRLKQNKTKKGNQFDKLKRLNHKKEQTQKKNQFDRDFEQKYGGQKKVDLELEQVLDFIKGGNMFGGARCKVPSYKSYNDKLNKINRKKFKKTMNELIPYFDTLEIDLKKLKSSYSNKLNNLRILYNLKKQKDPSLIKFINKYKVNIIDADERNKEVEKSNIQSSIKAYIRRFNKNKKEYNKIYKKFQKILKKYNNIYNKLKKNPEKKSSFLYKLNRVLDDYATYLELINKNYEDPGKDIKKLLTRGRKCEKKWFKVKEFYDTHLSGKNEVLSAVLTIESKNNQLLDFIGVELKKHDDITGEGSKYKKWEQESEKIYEILIKFLGEDNFKKSIGTIVGKTNKIKNNLENVISKIRQSNIEILEQQIISHLEMFLTMIQQVISNFQLIKKSTEEILTGLLELNDYRYMNERTTCIRQLHIQNIIRLITFGNYVQNIDDEKQIEFYTEMITSGETSLQTLSDYTGALKGNVSAEVVNKTPVGAVQNVQTVNPIPMTSGPLVQTPQPVVSPVGLGLSTSNFIQTGGSYSQENITELNDFFYLYNTKYPIIKTTTEDDSQDDSLMYNLIF